MCDYVVIREYRSGDVSSINQVIRSAYLSNVFNAWLTFLGKEITFQMTVLGAAIMFIFMGIPLQYCVVAIPVVMLVLFAFVYLSLLAKSFELTHGKPFTNAWVAEALVPLAEARGARSATRAWRIIDERRLPDEGLDLSRWRRVIVGTVSTAKFAHDENAAWLFRLAVAKRYRRKGVGQALVRAAERWCAANRRHTVVCAMSECQEDARKLFMNNRYLLKHMYHKQIIGSALTLLMYQLECPLITTFN